LYVYRLEIYVALFKRYFIFHKEINHKEKIIEYEHIFFITIIYEVKVKLLEIEISTNLLIKAIINI